VQEFWHNSLPCQPNAKDAAKDEAKDHAGASRNPG
jgi:hypothetical protein